MSTIGSRGEKLRMLYMTVVIAIQLTTSLTGEIVGRGMHMTGKSRERSNLGQEGLGTTTMRLRAGNGQMIILRLSLRLHTTNLAILLPIQVGRAATTGP